MPALSIIIPYRTTESALERTILSVLENRPRDCEIIVAHDGSYADPYHLSDELLLLEEASSKPIGMLNAALSAACAPVICVLAAGVTELTDGWADAAMQVFSRDQQTACVAVPTSLDSSTCYGIRADIVRDSSFLQRGAVDQQQPEIPIAPNLWCGFYDRKTLLSLGGWNDQLNWETADIELALLTARLGLNCQLVHSPVELDAQPSRSLCRASLKQLAEISIAYGLSSSGASAAMTDLLRGCLSGQIAGSVAWATGIIGGRGSASHVLRIARAESKYAQLQELRSVADRNGVRRVAA